MATDQLSSLRIEVDGRAATYGAGGEGPPVVFLHGWALGTRAYQRVVRRLTRRGCRVYAPALPGFAGTADLPRQTMSISGYSDWVDKFMDTVEIDEPALIIGHSFGGGVAIKLAEAHPDRVGYLVLLNSVGGVNDRPIWEWAWRFWRELFPTRQGIEIARAMRVSEALRATSIPTRKARTLLRSAPPLWLMSAPPSVLAGDVALCHPKLERGEVRAVARRIDDSNAVRLTVAAPDRPGLLGDTTGVLALHGLCITHASAATWHQQHLALHALTIENAADLNEAGWERLGGDLRTIGSRGAQVRPDFAPVGRATVSVYGSEPDRTLIRVLAPDQIGLLSRICRWFAEKDLSVESLHAMTDGEMARDVFLINGNCDAHDLASRLSRR